MHGSRHLGAAGVCRTGFWETSTGGRIPRNLCRPGRGQTGSTQKRLMVATSWFVLSNVGLCVQYDEGLEG